MKKLTQRNEQGFTIIEVVLVLAIAGLIFLIVFLALPQLQRSRRDTQRRNDVGRMLSSLENYASNNSGAYPAASTAGWSGFAGVYLTGDFNDPTTGEAYELTGTGVGNVATGFDAGDFRYARNGVCSGETIATGGGDRDVAILMKLETGAYCQDNQ